MLTRSLVLLALFVALVFAQEGEFVLRRAPNPSTTKNDAYFSAAVLEDETLHRRTPEPTKPGDYFGAAALEGDALGGSRRTPEPTKKDDYYWNGSVDKQNEDKPVAVVATTAAPVVAKAAPLTQQQLVEKLRVAREKINNEAVVKRQQIAVAQQKFVDAKDSCKRMVGKYKGIAKKIRDNVKKAQKSGNTLAVKRGKKAISNLKGRFKKDVLKCKQQVQHAKNTLMFRPFTSDNEQSAQAQDPALSIKLQKLRQVAQKQIKIEQGKVKRARKAHAKKLNKDFKKATDAAKKGKKSKLVNFVKKARKDAKKEIHQVLKFTQEAAKNTDVFTAKKMFIKARKHVNGIKKNFRSMKSKAKKALRAGKNKKSAKKGKKTHKKSGKKSGKKGKNGKKGKKHGKKTHKKSKRTIVKNNLIAKKAQHTIVLALKTGDKDLLEKGRRLARKARKVVKKTSKKSSAKSSKAKTLAKKAKSAQLKYKKMLKSGRTKCRSKKAFGKFKRALARARKNAKKLNAKVKKANKSGKKHAKKSKKHAKSNKARKCPK